ncbi:hypothetical protein ZOSMA_107G00810 [Zostera marina]|uniref:DRBM domain-containing protein n=1 Tax=Zostera marina TaxID=29655 RepID=A0A0K9Q471_ZOSMR|nr:hypothetical protein ZOSMA_107G00810 [Zostera marina]
MNKSRLNKLCQQHKFLPPEFEVERIGPDHDPRFKATVSIGELTFSGMDFCKSTKVAHSQAAGVALNHFISLFSTEPKIELPDAPVDGNVGVLGSLNETFVQSNEQPQLQEPTNSIPNVSEIETRNALDFAFACKSRLQNYAQKKKCGLPFYSTVQESSSTPPRFKATVTVQGKSYEGQIFANSIKAAENEAAKYALSFFPELPNEDDIYKNILQTLLQKEMKPLPIYKTAMDGPSHIPSFVSTVDIEGEQFVGKSAKSKKQAEQNAAKVAYNILFNEYKLMKPKSQSQHVSQQLVSQPSSNEPLSVICGENKEVSVFSIDPIHSIPELPTSRKNLNTSHPHDVSADTEDQTASKKTKIQLTQKLSSSKEKHSSDSSLLIPDLLQAIANENIAQRQKKVFIVPAKSGMVIPEGATILSSSDDSWVAFNINASN